MKKILIILLSTILLAGCTSGVSQEEYDKLLEENRIEDCKRIAKDPEFCQHLMEEFGIE